MLLIITSKKLEKHTFPKQNNTSKQNNTTTPWLQPWRLIQNGPLESLKGLSMKAPDNWWPGYNDQILHDGKIDSFDQSTQKWNLLL